MDLKISKKAEVKIDIKELTNIISDYIKNKEELRGYTITELTTLELKRLQVDMFMIILNILKALKFY